MADSKDLALSCGDYYEKKSPAVSAMSNENRPPSVNRITTPSRENSYWFAHGGGDEETPNRSNSKNSDNKEAQLQKEREERIRLFREQQEEERMKRLKEIENSFELSKKYREQQEEERKRKIEEARMKETERRQQVEERKRQIWEAEQERKEAILRRNLEREARIEARRNAQRNSMSFAFGSSTPRTFDLDLAALGNAPLGCSLMSSVSVRRSEEKEVVGVKRATSACSLDRKAEDSDFSSMGDDLTPNRSNNRAVSAEPELSLAKQIGIEHMNSDNTKACLTMFDDNSSFDGTSFINCSSSRWLTGSGALIGDDCMSRSMISLSSASRGRRRTDLTPVMTRERSVTPHTVPRAKDTSRSPSRPPSSMSGRSEVSMTSSQSSSVSLRPRPPPRKPRPVSIAGTTLDRSSVNLNNSWDKPIRSREPNGAPPLGPKPSRPKSSDLEAIVKNVIKKPVPPPKTAQILAKAKSHPVPTKDNLRKGVKMPSEVKKELPSEAKKELPSESKKELPKVIKRELPSKPEPAPVAPLSDAKTESPAVQELPAELGKMSNSMSLDSLDDNTDQLPNPVVNSSNPSDDNKPERESSPNQENGQDPESQQKKPRITSEEEAKAALAEKRRLAREQAEREAELERQRQEELRRQEEERRIQEELEQKRQEEEQIRLAELHRKLEEEKLQKAIEEQQQREKEEKEKREEEARLRLEKEEQDRKAREEAERQRLELEERARKEEQERAERKKRVEQIMSRTRNKNNAANNKQLVSPANEVLPVTEMSQSTDFTKSSNAANVILNSTVPENSVLSSGNDMQPNIFDSSTATQPLNLDILMTHSTVKNGFHGTNVEPSFVKNNTISSANCVPNRTPNSDAISPSQTNGYSSHEEMSVTSSPEDRSEKSNLSGGLLLDLQSAHPPPPNVIPRGHDDQLIDIGGSTNSSIDNYLIHPDVVNSNLVPSSDPFHTFENNLPKKQETAITDLLS